MLELNAILMIAYRDFTKLIHDRARILISLIFPLLFIGVLGGSLKANLSGAIGYDFLTFTFLGVIGQTLFSSTASGIISLIEDRNNDFSQEIFISPISRYSIIIGKIFGESLVSLTQLIGILIFGLILGIPLTFAQFIGLVPIFLLICFLGGGFGVLVLANLTDQRSANQVFPLIIFPQFFLAGVFNPIKVLPLYLDILSRLSPMRYAIDLLRGVYYAGKPEYSKTVLESPIYNLTAIGIMLLVFVGLGTYLFVRKERNK